VEKPSRRQQVRGVVAVAAALLVGAVLPVAIAAATGRHLGLTASAPVASCSPPFSSTELPVAAQSPPCGPLLQASPAAGLADGQLVTVTGASWSPKIVVGIVECGPGATSPTGCDLSTLLEVPTNGRGKFTTPYVVSRIIIPSGTPIDCASGGCFLGAANVNDFGEAASTPMAFDPNLPLAPPLQLGGTVNATDTVHVHQGIVELAGTVTCNRPAVVQLQGQLRQIYHRAIFSSYFFQQLLCLPTTTGWAVKVLPENGLFDVGNASVLVDLYGSADGSTSSASVTAKIQLTT